MIKFEETKGRVRDFCQEFYKVDSEGYVTRNEKRVDNTTVINDMVRKNKLSVDELAEMLG